MYGVKCSGKEDAIWRCPYRGFLVNTSVCANHKYDVAVQCNDGMCCLFVCCLLLVGCFCVGLLFFVGGFIFFIFLGGGGLLEFFLHIHTYMNT